MDENQEPIEKNNELESKPQEQNTETNNKEQEIVTEKVEEQDIVIESQELVLANQNEEPIKENKEKKGSYITGTIGAILGGLVAAIPWILTYTFANMIVAALAIIIAGGAFLGYKIFKGKIGKAFPVIITIVSLLVVTIVTTVICPSILMIQSEYPITWDNLISLYISEARTNVRDAIIQDLIVSLVFTIIGIASIVHSISVQIKNGADGDKIQFNTVAMYEELKEQVKEQSETVKKACLGLNCMSKENKATKQEIINELEMTYNLERKKAKQYFATCGAYKLLKKNKGKYYYDEAEELLKIENLNSRRVSPRKIIVITIVALVLGVLAGILVSNLNKENYTISGTSVELEIADTQNFYGTREEIINAFGEEAASYYDFILFDKNEKYELYGQVVSKEYYEDADFATVIQEDRDYYAPYVGEDIISDVEDKKLGEDAFKSYNYTYAGTSGEQYRAIIYLYEEENNYIWINIYTDIDVEFTQIDTIVDNLIK